MEQTDTTENVVNLKDFRAPTTPEPESLDSCEENEQTAQEMHQDQESRPTTGKEDNENLRKFSPELLAAIKNVHGNEKEQRKAIIRYAFRLEKQCDKARWRLGEAVEHLFEHTMKGWPTAKSGVYLRRTLGVAYSTATKAALMYRTLDEEEFFRLGRTRAALLVKYPSRAERDQVLNDARGKKAMPTVAELKEAMREHDENPERPGAECQVIQIGAEFEPVSFGRKSWVQSEDRKLTLEVDFEDLDDTVLRYFSKAMSRIGGKKYRLEKQG